MMSEPGALLPPDDDAHFYISPSTAMDPSLLTELIPKGAPLYGPSTELRTPAIVYTNWEKDIADARDQRSDPLAPGELGRLRIEVLRTLSSLDSSLLEVSDEQRLGIFMLAAESVATVSALGGRLPRPTMLWNPAIPPLEFVARSGLFADHVLAPDLLFDTLLRTSDARAIQRAALAALEHEPLIRTGHVLFVPDGVARYLGADVAAARTDQDLTNQELVAWVQDQLQLEGPTAREALFVRAKDDATTQLEKFWLHAHIEPGVSDGGEFRSRLLGAYRTDYDYEPWISHVRREATAQYIQRANERVAGADALAAEHVTNSLFDARLLARRRSEQTWSASQAALWATIPVLGKLDADGLASVLLQEEAIADFRARVQAAVVNARSAVGASEEITRLGAELEVASNRLGRDLSDGRKFDMVVPGSVTAATMLIGNLSGGLGAVATAAAAAGALSSAFPYLAQRRSVKRDAAYLFLVAHNAARKASRRRVRRRRR